MGCLLDLLMETEESAAVHEHKQRLVCYILAAERNCADLLPTGCSYEGDFGEMQCSQQLQGMGMQLYMLASKGDLC